VLLQVLFDPEPLATGDAVVRLLPRVEAQVRLQVLPQAEALAAVGAGVRPLARVEAQVAPEALPQRERLGARGARVRLLAGVEALVPPEDLPPRERLVAEGARVAVAAVGHHHLPQPPHAVLAGGEAAEAAARVEALVAPEVFGQRPSSAAGVALTLGGGGVHRGLGRGEHVHQLHGAGPRQPPVGRVQLQSHVEVALALVGRVDALPHRGRRRGHRAVGRRRAVGGALGGADADLLGLRFNGLLRRVRFRGLRPEDRRADDLHRLPGNGVVRFRLDREELPFRRRAPRRLASQCPRLGD